MSKVYFAVKNTEADHKMASFSLTCSISFVFFRPLINRPTLTVIQSQSLKGVTPWFTRCSTLGNNGEISHSMLQRHVLHGLTDVAVAVAVAVVVDGVLPSALLSGCPCPAAVD